MSEPKPPNKIWIRYRKDPNAKLQVARFQTCYPMDLTKLAPPIHMMRERDPPPEETPAAAPTAAPGTSSSSSAATAAAASSSSSAPAGSAAATAAGATPAPIPSLYAGVPLHQRPWILEDSDQSRFRGTEEKGAQTSSSYFVFMQERPGEYTAIPVESWFNFRPHSLAKAAAIEGVEQELAKAKLLAAKWIEKRVRVEDDVFVEDDGSRAAQDDLEAALNNREDDDDDIDFEGNASDDEDVPDKRIQKEIKQVKVLSDSESDEEEESLANPGAKEAGEDDEDEELIDEEDEKPQEKLSDAAKSLRKMLKDYSKNEMPKVKPRTEGAPPVAPTTVVETKPVITPAPLTRIVAEPARPAQQIRPAAPAPNAPPTDNPNGSDSAIGRKRKREDDNDDDEKESKKPKKLREVTRDSVIELIRRKGKIKSKDLVKKFKLGMRPKEEVSAVSAIIGEVATLTEIPPNSGKKYLVLKDEYA